MFDYFASLFGLGGGGDDGSRKVVSSYGPTGFLHHQLSGLDLRIRMKVERGERLTQSEIRKFQAETRLNELFDYRLER